MKRRDFLRNTALASTALMMPQFLRAVSPHFTQSNGKILVVIQWSGGVDGLNAFVPYRNDLYYKARPAIGIAKDDVLDLNGEMGLHPELFGLKDLYDDGMLSIYNSVGYPNANRSHFKAMDIWHTASGTERSWQTGWIGRYLDTKCCENHKVHEALYLNDDLDLALMGEKAAGLATSRPAQLHRLVKKAGKDVKVEFVSDEHLNYMYKVMRDTKESADELHKYSKIHKSLTEYPNTGLGRSLKNTAELIISGLDTSVYYVSFDGFDTHAFQGNKHNRLFQEYSKAISSFIKDLKDAGRMDDVLVMNFSEFGRRVKENASRGTDHGKANQVFLIGNRLKGGVLNQAPDLENLDEGDLKFQLDFRRIYSTVLNKWMGQDDELILKSKYQYLNLLA